jgi:hypothetical protein
LLDFPARNSDDGFGASLKDGALREPAIDPYLSYLFLGAVFPTGADPCGKGRPGVRHHSSSEIGIKRLASWRFLCHRSRSIGDSNICGDTSGSGNPLPGSAIVSDNVEGGRNVLSGFRHKSAPLEILSRFLGLVWTRGKTIFKKVFINSLKNVKTVE